jgi:hypothetical protein
LLPKSIPDSARLGGEGVAQINQGCRVKPKAKYKQARRKHIEVSPVTVLESELHGLHRDLRTTAKAYLTRLENDLLVCLATLRSLGPIEKVSRDMLRQIRDLTIIIGNRKLKPEKGRRKDLRKIDSLIVDLVAAIGRKS